MGSKLSVNPLRASVYCTGNKSCRVEMIWAVVGSELSRVVVANQAVKFVFDNDCEETFEYKFSRHGSFLHTCLDVKAFEFGNDIRQLFGSIFVLFIPQFLYKSGRE
jgi:hypothetical protein